MRCLKWKGYTVNKQIEITGTDWDMETRPRKLRKICFLLLLSMNVDQLCHQSFSDAYELQNGIAFLKMRCLYARSTTLL